MNAHRGRAEHVALDRDSVAIATGDLHDRRVTSVGEQRADCDAGHMAVRARSICRVDRIADLRKNECGVEDVVRVGAIRRVEFRGYREQARAQDFFQPTIRFGGRQRHLALHFG